MPRRLLLVLCCLTSSALAPLAACLNDPDLERQETEFRSSYEVEPPAAEPEPSGLVTPTAVAGFGIGVGLLMVLAALGMHIHHHQRRSIHARRRG